MKLSVAFCTPSAMLSGDQALLGHDRDVATGRDERAQGLLT